MMHEHPFAQFHFCPKCGSPRFVEHNEKSKQCEDCGFVYYFNPSAATVAVILNERQELLTCRRGKANRPKARSTCPADSQTVSRAARRSSTGSQRRNRTGSNPHGISVFPAQHLPVFRISGTHRRLFLPLYGGRQQPGPCHGRCSRTVVDSHERIAPGRLRSGIREKRHRKAVGTMPLIPSPKGRLGACYSIYSKKIVIYKV